MTFTELAAAIDSAETELDRQLAIVKQTELTVEAFLAQKGTELAVLREDVTAAKDGYAEANRALNELYSALRKKMPGHQTEVEPVQKNTLPTSQEMKQIITEAHKLRGK